MNVSAEEKIMYEVMKALYDSGMIVLKHLSKTLFQMVKEKPHYDSQICTVIARFLFIPQPYQTQGIRHFHG